MRPKKTILLVNWDQDQLSTMAYLLSTVGGYRVLQTLNAEDAIALFSGSAVDLAMATHALPPDGGDKLLLRLKTIRRVPTVLLGNPAGDELRHADALLNLRISAADLLARVAVLIARRRGPRKGSTHIRPPRPVESALAGVLPQ